jgi:hypothetical protein
VQNILKAYTPREVDQNKKAELDKIMTAQAKQYGMGTLPVMDIR